MSVSQPVLNGHYQPSRVLSAKHKVIPTPSPLLTDLYHYFKMEQTTGDIVDSHNSYSLAENNTPGFEAGVNGNCRTYTRANLEGHFGNENGPNVTTSYTFTFWIKPDYAGASSTQYVYGRSNSYNLAKSLFFVFMNSWKISFAQYYGSGSTNILSSSLTLADNTWYFVVGWYDSSLQTINLEINDGNNVSKSHTQGIGGDQSGQYWGIGGGVSTANRATLSGSLDEIGFWTRLLLSSEKTQLYGGGTPPTYPFS